MNESKDDGEGAAVDGHNAMEVNRAGTALATRSKTRAPPATRKDEKPGEHEEWAVEPGPHEGPGESRELLERLALVPMIILRCKFIDEIRSRRNLSFGVILHHRLPTPFQYTAPWTNSWKPSTPTDASMATCSANIAYLFSSFPRYIVHARIFAVALPSFSKSAAGTLWVPTIPSHPPQRDSTD